MRYYSRYVLAAATGAILVTGADMRVRSAYAAPPPSTQNVTVVGPLAASGAVATEGTIKGLVNVRTNPALTHVGVLASDVVTIHFDSGGLTEIPSDGTSSNFTGVPAGKALIITDLEWVLNGSAGLQAEIFLRHLTGGTVFSQIDRFDQNGYWSGRAALTTGIAFGPLAVPDFVIGLASGAVYAHGYYVAAP